MPHAQGKRLVQTIQICAGCQPELRNVLMRHIGGYSRTGRRLVPVAERGPITGELTPALWSPDLVVI
jgi:hypothetical protein